MARTPPFSELVAHAPSDLATAQYVDMRRIKAPYMACFSNFNPPLSLRKIQRSSFAGPKSKLYLEQQMPFNRKFVALPLLAVAICVGLYVFVRRDGNVVDDASSPQAGESALSNESVDIGAHNISLEKSSSETSPRTMGAGHEVPTPEEEVIIREWQESLGYVDYIEQNGVMVPQSNSYDSYPVKTLQQIADLGDRNAQLLFAQKMMEAGNVEAAKPYLIQASVRGFTKSVIDLAQIHMDIGSQTDINGAKESMIEAYAWLVVASRRGDLNGDLLRQGIQRGPFKLDNADVQRAEEVARGKYDSLLAERRRIGLPDFDNAAPAAMEKVRKMFAPK
ncbi:MAG: hypothetical protein ACOY3E_03035 [Pseudomonadota bacterium]